MSMLFNNFIYHVCQLLYYSTVPTLYKHGTDMHLCQVVRMPDAYSVHHHTKS